MPSPSDSASPRLARGEITELFFSAGGLIATELSGAGGWRSQDSAPSRPVAGRRREGRNPRTGKALSIKAATVPAFRAARGLRDLMNRKR